MIRSLLAILVLAPSLAAAPVPMEKTTGSFSWAETSTVWQPGLQCHQVTLLKIWIYWNDEHVVRFWADEDTQYFLGRRRVIDQEFAEWIEVLGKNGHRVKINVWSNIHCIIDIVQIEVD